MKLITLLIAWAFATMPAASQTPAQKPKFEVASIKPVAGQSPRFMNTPPGGRYLATGQSLRALVVYAYRMRDYQVIGGPSWAATDLWEIQAKALEGSVQPTPNPDLTQFDAVERMLSQPDTIALMLQSLLEDRFQVRVHRETREMTVYELVVAKGGLKMQLAADQTPPEPPPRGQPPQRPNGELPRGTSSIRFGPQWTFEGRAIPFWTLFNTVRNALGRPIIDKANLKGLYDIKLIWTPEGPPNTDATPSGISIFTALQEQVGLKLESTKGSVEVLVIDSAQRPSEN